jgi:hypothetical protein
VLSTIKLALDSALGAAVSCFHTSSKASIFENSLLLAAHAPFKMLMAFGLIYYKL